MLSNLFHQKLLWPAILLIAANSLILAQAPLGLRYPAVLLLLALLPGWIWGQFFFAQLLDLTERLTLVLGLSLAFTILGTLFAVYLPEPLTLNQLLIVINVIILAGLGIVGWKHQVEKSSPVSIRQLVPISLILLLVLAAGLRLTRLGYAEFHEDEAEALMLGVRLLQGEDYAIFLHRKGPAQMLLPVAFWLLTDRIDETLARFPFALSSIFSVAAIFILGRRWLNWQVGLLAALLWAINGYAIAFGRMVQYQAIIFFLGPLALFCLYQAWRTGWWRWQILGAILLATCLLAHFDALLLLPAAAYVGWVSLSKSQIKLAHAIGTAALFLTILAAFYIPYALDPDFGNTAIYLTESRIRPGLLYNNLDLLRRFDRDYSSHFYLPLLGLGLISFILQSSGAGGWGTGTREQEAKNREREEPQPEIESRKQFTIHNSQFTIHNSSISQSPNLLISLPLLILSASTFWLPNLWQFGNVSLAVVPWLLLLTHCFWLAPTIEHKTAWLMFGTPLIGYVFLVDDPRTHLYILYPGAVLLAGAGWNWLANRARALILSIGLLWITAILIYLTLIFLSTESNFTALRSQWDDSVWEQVYDDLPQPREYFGYPKREGWKTVGALRTQGLFPGDFRSVNEDFIVPIWYNYGQARSCYNTPAHFFVRTTGIEPFEAEPSYNLTAHIAREGEPRLQIFASDDSPTVPPVYQLADYETMFDQLASPQQFAQQTSPAQRVEAQFGPAIKFVGFDLPTPTLTPGDTLHLNLYWQAIQPPGDQYRAFVHLTDGATLWSQQDDNPACRLPTTVWRANQRGLGQFRLSIPPDMPPGRYPLIIGLYQVDTLERLVITGGAGQPGDDFLWLGDIEIIVHEVS